MSLHVSETGSGLLVAENVGGHQDVARLLRQHDPALRLVPQWDEARAATLWCVFSYNGSDREADFVCAWQTPQGEPLPLSTRLLEKVQQLDRRTAGDAPDPDKLNAAHVAAQQRDRRNTLETIADDHRPYVDRGRVAVSLTDVKTAKPGYQRSRRPKASGE